MESSDCMKKQCLNQRQTQRKFDRRRNTTSTTRSEAKPSLLLPSCTCGKSRSICFPSLGQMWTLCLFLLLLCGTGLGAAPDTLRFANIMFRHGDRTPMASFPGDMHKEEDWGLQGYQQLTKEGKQQEYELGQFLRQRYDGFLNQTYLKTEVAAFSTATDRTLMSGQLVLAGLYPPQGAQMWNSDIKWQPIPLQSGAADQNTISKGLYWLESCPKYQDIVDKLMKSKQVLQELKQFQLLLDINKELMSNKSSSHSFVKNSPMWNVWLLYDTVFIERLKNMTIPSWATEDFFKQGPKFIGWVLHMMYAGDRARYRGGYILSHWMKKMSEIAERKLDKLPRKVQLYSGHDSTVGAMLNALGIHQNTSIPYSSVLMVELHEHKTGNYSIQIWYRTDRKKPPVLLQPPGCGNPCEFSTWMEMLSAKYTYKYPLEIECERFTIFGLKQWMSIAVVAGAGGLVLFFFLIICICCCRKKMRPEASTPKETCRRDGSHS